MIIRGGDKSVKMNKQVMTLCSARHGHHRCVEMKSSRLASGQHENVRLGKKKFLKGLYTLTARLYIQNISSAAHFISLIINK